MPEASLQNFLIVVYGLFALGWLAAKFGVWVSNRTQKVTRDPRDDRIRSLEADHRVAKTDSSKAAEESEGVKEQLKEAEESVAKLEQVKGEQHSRIEQLRKDLKDSVKKTRELRAELSDRATENVRSEVKLREVETELEVTRASTDLIATGVLDYSVTPESDDDETGRKVSKVAT